jgi:membrane fusion protein (multidrug efflux system)
MPRRSFLAWGAASSRLLPALVVVCPLLSTAACKRLEKDVHAAQSTRVHVETVEAGQYVMPNTKVATLVSLDVLKVKISVPEMQLAKVHKDLQVTFRVGPLGDRVFSAKVVRVSPTVRTGTRDVLAEAEVVNTDKALRPGMFAKIELPLGEVELPTIPKTALVTRDGANHVFVLTSGKIEERSVQLAQTVGDDVVVTKGVAAGERVVRKPTPEVKNGLLAE